MFDVRGHSSGTLGCLPPAGLADGTGPQDLVAGAKTVEGTRGWSCLAARARIVRCDGSYSSERHFTRPAIVAVLETIGGDLRVDCAGGEPRINAGSSAHLSLVPAETTVRLEASRISLFREVVIEIVRRPALADARREDEALDFAPRTMIVDRDLLRVAELIAADCLSGRPSDRVYGDSLSIVLLKALSRLTEFRGKASCQGGLAPWQLRRVTEFLDANLVGGARIEALAALVNLSSSYLIRAFKVSTGMTPQQWLRVARIRRAQQLLIDEDKSLASVAQETGFADQAHLTRIFGQTIGESPGAWRRARRAGPRGGSVPLSAPISAAR